MNIRPATEADEPAIKRLVYRAGINRMDLRWPNFLVAEEHGDIVGVGQVKPHGDGSRELASLAVVPAMQGSGLGSALVEGLIAREPGVLHLTCRSGLEGYYERFGFRRIGRADYPPYFRRLIPLVNLFASLLGLRILVMRRARSRP